MVLTGDGCRSPECGGYLWVHFNGKVSSRNNLSISFVHLFIHPVREGLAAYGVDDVAKVLPWKLQDFILCGRQCLECLTIVELSGPVKHVLNIQAIKIWDANIFNIITFDEHFLVGHDVTAMVDCHGGI